jgi:hypothetical protein
MNKNKKIIKFKAEDDYYWNVALRPTPASLFLPQWYKDAPVHVDNQKFNLDPAPNITFKRCFPFLDALTAGYISPLWADCQIVYNENEGTNIKWVVKRSVFDVWNPKQISTFEIPDGFDGQVFKYMHGWIPKTPAGYSTLITHPFAYQNLPFRAVTGIVDTDTLDTGAYVPIIFKKGWEGVLEKGTPMFQLIPFKRDDWVSEYKNMDENENFYNVEKLHTKIISSYGKFLRKKKSYI